MAGEEGRCTNLSSVSDFEIIIIYTTVPPDGNNSNRPPARLDVDVSRAFAGRETVHCNFKSGRMTNATRREETSVMRRFYDRSYIYIFVNRFA